MRMRLFSSKNARAVPTREQISERIQEIGKDKKTRYVCPICRNSRWEVAGVLSHQLEPEAGAPSTAKTFVPTALLICGGCAYCAQFSLVALGLIE